MANNYCESSSMFSLKKNEITTARKIIKEVEEQLENDTAEGYVGFLAIIEADGVWIRAEENINAEHVEILVRRLIDGLKRDEPFAFSWAYTCSKLRINEFGGGACSIKRGEETFWVDAMLEAENHFEKKEN